LVNNNRGVFSTDNNTGMLPVNPDDYRYEIKIPLQKTQFYDLKGYLNQLSVVMKRTYPDRAVNSIYIDSIDLNNYLDNVTGISRRKKIRFRWYGNNIDSLVLESKEKIGKVSRKNIVQLNNAAGIYPRSRGKYLTLLRNNRTDIGWPTLSTLFPILEVNYHRSYYELASQIRMTIDTGISYRRLFPTEKPNFFSSPVYAVVEFKYPLHLAGSANKIIAGLPFRVFRHSKYVVGVDLVCG